MYYKEKLKQWRIELRKMELKLKNKKVVLLRKTSIGWEWYAELLDLNMSCKRACPTLRGIKNSFQCTRNRFGVSKDLYVFPEFSDGVAVLQEGF